MLAILHPTVILDTSDMTLAVITPTNGHSLHIQPGTPVHIDYDLYYGQFQGGLTCNLSRPFWWSDQTEDVKPVISLYW